MSSPQWLAQPSGHRALATWSEGLRKFTIDGAAAACGFTMRMYGICRVRLPVNPESKRGVVLGEGKPENQNHAVIFCHNEALQSIDMNQVRCAGIFGGHLLSWYSVEL